MAAGRYPAAGRSARRIRVAGPRRGPSRPPESALTAERVDRAPPAGRRPPQAIRDLLDPGAGARLVFVTARRAADADGADHLVARLERETAAQHERVIDVFQVGRRRVAGDSLAQFGRAGAEGQGGVRLPAAAVQSVGGGAVVAQRGLDAARAIHDGRRHAIAVLAASGDRGQRGVLRQGQRHLFFQQQIFPVETGRHAGRDRQRRPCQTSVTSRFHGVLLGCWGGCPTAGVGERPGRIPSSSPRAKNLRELKTGYASVQIQIAEKPISTSGSLGNWPRGNRHARAGLRRVGRVGEAFPTSFRPAIFIAMARRDGTTP